MLFVLNLLSGTPKLATRFTGEEKRMSENLSDERRRKVGIGSNPSASLPTRGCG